MDPTETLNELRVLVGRVDDGDIRSIEGMVDRFNALDKWLCRGGFLPIDWRPIPYVPDEGPDGGPDQGAA